MDDYKRPCIPGTHHFIYPKGDQQRLAEEQWVRKLTKRQLDVAMFIPSGRSARKMQKSWKRCIALQEALRRSQQQRTTG